MNMTNNINKLRKNKVPRINYIDQKTNKKYYKTGEESFR